MTATIAVKVGGVVGSTLPLNFTPPAVIGPPGPCGCGCALTEETSYGFKVLRFAESKLGIVLFPWQRFLVIHAGELTALGLPRFREILVIVGRQNGKTELLVVLALYWMFEEQQPSILGTSKLTIYAEESWKKAYNVAMKVPELKARMAEKERERLRTGAGKERWWNLDGNKYSIKSANDAGGRSMQNSRVIADELAKQYDRKAYGAAYPSMGSFADAQYWGLTTPDPLGVVYQWMRKLAMKAITEKTEDVTLGMFEWASAPGSDPLDANALAQSNPSMGFLPGKSPAILLADAQKAIDAGGELLHSFKEEIMCLRMDDEESVINPEKWKLGFETVAVDARADKLAMCIDVADSGHTSLYAGLKLPNGTVRIAGVQEWDDPEKAVEDLRDIIAATKPTLGWLPDGPAAQVGSALNDPSPGGRHAVWPPPGVTIEEIKADRKQACMGLVSMVNAGKLLHPEHDERLNEQANAVEKRTSGDGWVFDRRKGDIEALYAAAGAAHLARLMSKPVRRGKVIVSSVA